MRITGVIQARYNSTRLPGKALMDIDGIPSIVRQYQRMSWAKLTGVAWAIPHKDAQYFLPVGERYGIIQIVTGPEEDCLTRVLRAAYATSADAVAVVGGDCPFVCPNIINGVVDTYVRAEGQALFVSNCIRRTWPDGCDVELYATSLLSALDKRLSGTDREWFAAWCRRNLERRFVREYVCDDDWSRIRLTMDYPEDHLFAETMYKKIGKPIFCHWAVIDALVKEPKLKEINAMHCTGKFGDKPE